MARVTLRAGDGQLSAASNTAASNPTNIIPAFYLILYNVVMSEALWTQSYKWFQHHSLKLYIQSRYSIPATIMSTSPLSVSSSSMRFLFEV